MHTQEGVTPQPVQPEDAHTPMEATAMLRYLIDNMPLRSEVATKDDIAAIRSEMATKEDVRKMIGEAKQELKDHTTRECAKVRGDLISVAHRQDEKTNEFVRTAQKSGTISCANADRLVTINPFAQPAD